MVVALAHHHVRARREDASLARLAHFDLSRLGMLGQSSAEWWVFYYNLGKTVETWPGARVAAICALVRQTQSSRRR